MIPLVDLKAQLRTIREEIDEAVAGVLESTQFIQGPEVQAFEEEFASYCGAQYGIGVASGTAALHLALRASGIGPGDEVITTPLTFISTVEAIVWVGATPVLADIDPVTYNLDPAQVESAVTDRTRAIIPVHLFGHPVDMDPLMEIGQRRGIAIIEDAAQAHGAEYNGRRTGSMGVAGCFSFYPSKNLGAYGDGGLVTTSDAEVARRVRLLRDHGREEKYWFIEPGFGERLDTIQAAILRVKLRHLDEWTERRRAVAALYDELLEDALGDLPHERGFARHVYHLYVVRVPHRDKIAGLMLQRNVATGVPYPTPVHLQPAYRDLGYRLGDLPEAERAAQEVISLPMYAEMNAELGATVALSLKEALGSVGAASI